MNNMNNKKLKELKKKYPYTLDLLKHFDNVSRERRSSTEIRVERTASILERYNSKRISRNNSELAQQYIMNRKESHKKLYEEKLCQEITKNKTLLEDIFNIIGSKIKVNIVCNICSYERESFIKSKCCSQYICINCIYIETIAQKSYRCMYCRHKLIDCDKYNELLLKNGNTSDDDFEYSSFIGYSNNSDNSMQECYYIAN